MELGNIWVKIASNIPLTPDELGFLKRAGNETQQRNSFVAGNTTPQNKLNIDFPFIPLYNELLTVDVSSLSIDLPQNYNHLFILTSGRSTDSSSGLQTFSARFNDDSGANYNLQYLSVTDTVISALSGTSETSLAIGGLVGDLTTANEVGCGFAVIPNYRTSFYKQALTYLSAKHDTSLITGVWNSVEAIQKITIFANVGNIKAGSSISVFGFL